MRKQEEMRKRDLSYCLTNEKNPRNLRKNYYMYGGIFGYFIML